MGYKRPTLKLVFADPEFEGLEVRARRLSIGAALRVAGLADMDTRELAAAEEKLGELLKLIAESLISWNLEDDNGTPVPLTGEALAEQDLPFITALAGALATASAGVSRPLEPASNSGPSSEEVSLPMEPLSESPPS